MTGLMLRMRSWFFLHPEMEEIQRRKLQAHFMEERYEQLRNATIDGENEWFLELKKKNPDCVIRVFDECIEDKK